MNWTASQKNAIESKDKTLLVSAGAGSGKTTVLTRRLTERILAGDSVEDFLVVTFTKASAADLKEKLYNTLTDAIAEQPQNRHLFNQLFLLPGANISTIHSFCFNIIKKNFASLGLSPKVRIADETEASIIARSCLEELVDKLYERDEKNFLLLVDNFGSEKSDDKLMDILLSLYYRLRAFHNYAEWPEKQKSILLEQAELVKTGYFNTLIGKKAKEKILQRLGEAKNATEQLLSFACNAAASETNIAPIEAMKQNIDNLLAAAKVDYKTLFLAISEQKTPKVNTREMNIEDAEYLKQEKGRITKEIKDIRDCFCTYSEQRIHEDFLNSAEITGALSYVLSIFDDSFANEKRSRGILDFSDLEQYLAALLEEKDEDGFWHKTELCERLRKSIKEVYIDEYQDVNPLQDHIFTLLSRSDNRFMVGDIKQSIYRFRNAYPDIFIDYKESFPDFEESGDSPWARIFLKENFRCGKPIIEFVNSVFSTVASKNRFEREYKGEELVFAKSGDVNSYPVTVAMSLYNKEEVTKEEATEREAEYVAAEIKRLIGTKKENGEPLNYGDIVLLFSAVKERSKVFVRALRKQGIPCVTEQDESLFKMPEIMLAVSALKTVDNPTDDISLCSLLRSPLFDFTAEELYLIRTRFRGLSMFDSVAAFSCLNNLKRKKLKQKAFYVLHKFKYPPKSLVKKCSCFIAELKYYRTKAQGMLCYKFLWLFYMRSGFLSAAGGFENGDKCRANLLLLYQYARNFESTGFKGLSSFIMYLEDIADRGADLANAKLNKQDGNIVRIMSIHKSKGLEFPVCFLVDTARNFGSRDAKGDLLLSREFGFGYRIRDAEKLTIRETCNRRIISVAEKDNSMDEELRKLYVAMTRARERLYVTCCVTEDYTEKAYNPMGALSFSDWILHTVIKKEHTFFNTYIIPESDTFITERAIEVTETIAEDINQDFKGRAEAIIDYFYPYSAAAETAAKLSVTELPHGKVEKAVVNEKMILSRPRFAQTQMSKATERGTANHIFMQFASFDYLEENGIIAEAKRLLQRKMITQEQYELLSFSSINAFFSSELYRKMRSAKKIYREKRFSITESAEWIGGPRDENILVQGVIDCFFENADGSFTLVDYKTDVVPKESGEKILIERHREQLLYYSKAVALMTGRQVSTAIIYSFSLNKAIEVDL